MKDGLVVWFSGLSGAGKSTIADGVNAKLTGANYRFCIIDGDNVRQSINRHLGFSRADILENNACIAELCKDARRKADVVLVPIISPYRAGRQRARSVLGDNFVEVYVKASLSCVSGRDVKSLYAKAKRGEIDNLVGFSPGSPFEPPDDPDLILDTEFESTAKSIDRLADFLKRRLSNDRAARAAKL